MRTTEFLEALAGLKLIKSKLRPPGLREGGESTMHNRGLKSEAPPLVPGVREWGH